MKSGASRDHVEPWLSEASDASPELRAFLREASTHPEDAARVERLRQRLGPWLVATTVPPAAPPPSGVTAGSSIAAAGKACLFALGVGSLVASGAWLVDGGVTPPEPAPPALIPLATPSVAAPVPAATSAVARPSPVQSSTPPHVPSSRKPASSLAEEAAELATAQRALASSPARSLTLLQRHAARFPRGALAEERHVFTIEALLALSRPEEARRELSRMELGFPRSPHLARARRLAGIDASSP